MLNFALYAVTVAIWGSTWLAITFQLRDNGAAVASSVGWRFVIAALILLVWCGFRRISLRLTLRQYAMVALQGLTNFSLNYWLVYRSEQLMPSGLVAMIFSLLMVFNIVGARLFFGQKIAPRATLGALLGITGMMLVLWPALEDVALGVRILTGVLIAVSGTLCASTGNLLSAHGQTKGIPLIPGLTIGMGFGGVTMLGLGWISGEDMRLPMTLPYLGSLFYLSLFGSVIAFAAYMSLIARVGAGRASYNGVMIPIVALVLSSLFENYHWQFASAIGVACSVAGNVLVMRGKMSS